jgi:type IV secretory pathway TraG/TraD family ATPase VirD4
MDTIKLRLTPFARSLRETGLLPSLLFLPIAWLVDRLLCRYMNDLPELISAILIPASHLAAFALWLVFSCLCFFIARYNRKTGRNYLEDKKKYGLSYRELLDFFMSADEYRLNIKTLPVEDWRVTEGIILGQVGNRLVKRASKGVGNLAVFSLPGGGKTTSQIIPSALQFQGAVLAIDIKGDILAQTKNVRNIKIFAPDNPVESLHYNPLSCLATLSDVERKTEIEQIALILLPDGQDNGGDGKYFIEGGRDYFCGIALYLLEQTPSTTLPDIARAIVEGNAFSWATDIANSTCVLAKSYTSAYIGSNEKNVAGAYGTAVKALRPFAFGALSNLLDGSGECITPETLENGCDVYIEIPQDKIKLYAPVSTLIIQQFLTSFMRRPDCSTGKDLLPILFLLDEFPQLSFDYDTLSAALSTLRSKRVSLFLAMQSISQLTQRYGEAGFRSIIDTCAYISIMSAQDPQSREFFSKLCGTRKALKVGTSGGETSFSRSTQEDREPIFQPADFGNLGDDVIIVANGKYVRAQKTYFYK